MKICQYFFSSYVSNINISKRKATWKPTARNLFFFLSYLKPTHVMSFKNTLGFSVDNCAGIMKKSAISKIISSLNLQSQLTFSLHES